MDKKKTIITFDDYMNDETRVSPADRKRIYKEVSIIGKMLETREEEQADVK